MSGIARIRNKKITFAPRKRQGEMLEWLKRHAWKACKRRNRFGGSNPPLSAGRVGFKSFLRKGLSLSAGRAKDGKSYTLLYI